MTVVKSLGLKRRQEGYVWLWWRRGGGVGELSTCGVGQCRRIGIVAAGIMATGASTRYRAGSLGNYTSRSLSDSSELSRAVEHGQGRRWSSCQVVLQKGKWSPVLVMSDRDGD